MDFEVFSLCDAANDSNGKLNMLGAFDTITAKKLPSSHPVLNVAVRIRFYSEEYGDHMLSCEIKDTKNNVIASLFDKYHFSVSNKEEESVIANFIATVVMLEFKEYGRHIVSFSVDGNVVKEIPLYLKQ